jgi:hypothetical protein
MEGRIGYGDVWGCYEESNAHLVAKEGLERLHHALLEVGILAVQCA